MTRHVTLAEHFWLAEQLTGVDANTLAKASRSDLADSALHAPQAGFGDVEFYPDIYDQAAVLVCRLAWNHPLPDGNKRVAWAALVMFIDLNHGTWSPDPPDIDQAEVAGRAGSGLSGPGSRCSGARPRRAWRRARRPAVALCDP